MRILDKCVSSTHRTQVTAQSIISYMERYRSGHNGADSKSDGRVIPARGFESHPLRHFFSKSLPVLNLVPDFPIAKLLPNSGDFGGRITINFVRFVPSFTAEIAAS